MSLVLPIFLKDLRRLWPAAGLTLAMLAYLTHTDSWRADWLLSAEESWLNFLLPLAWACTIALAVLQEPLAGIRHYWLTRPYRWYSLLTAKLVFAAVVVHAPLFVSDFYVLLARDFPAFAQAGWLLHKQLVVLAVVTLPSLAIASLVRTFTHFALVLFGVAFFLIVTSYFHEVPLYGYQTRSLRDAVVLLTFGAAAAAITWLQFKHRKPWASRLLSIAAGCSIAVLSILFPVHAEYSASSLTANSRPVLELREAKVGEFPTTAFRVPGHNTVALPILIRPRGPAADFHVTYLDGLITTPDGLRIPSGRRSHRKPPGSLPFVIFPYTTARNEPASWLVLTFNNDTWNRVKDKPVRISGVVGLSFYRLGRTTTISTQQRQASVPMVGRCSSSAIEPHYGEPMLKVFCEQPEQVPPTRIELRHDVTGRAWPQFLNSARTYTSGPMRGWLSPIARGQSFFRIAETAEATGAGGYEVPPAAAADGRIDITPEVRLDQTLANFELNNVRLQAWRLPR